MDQLVAVDIGVAPCRRREHGRRRDVAHDAVDEHLVPLPARLDRGFRDGFVADTGAMHIGLVRQVDQIVDQQLVMRPDMEAVAERHPAVLVQPGHRRQERRIGGFGRPHPDPDPAVFLDRRIGAQSGAARHPVLARHGDASAVRVIGEAVIAADQPVADQPPLRQRQAAVDAAVYERARNAVLGAEEHDRLAAHRAGERGAADLRSGGRDVPSLLDEHALFLPDALWWHRRGYASTAQRALRRSRNAPIPSCAAADMRVLTFQPSPTGNSAGSGP